MLFFFVPFCFLFTMRNTGQKVHHPKTRNLSQQMDKSKDVNVHIDNELSRKIAAVLSYVDTDT